MVIIQMFVFLIGGLLLIWLYFVVIDVVFPWVKEQLGIGTSTKEVYHHPTLEERKFNHPKPQEERTLRPIKSNKSRPKCPSCGSIKKRTRVRSTTLWAYLCLNCDKKHTTIVDGAGSEESINSRIDESITGDKKTKKKNYYWSDDELACVFVILGKQQDKLYTELNIKNERMERDKWIVRETLNKIAEARWGPHSWPSFQNKIDSLTSSEFKSPDFNKIANQKKLDIIEKMTKEKKRFLKEKYEEGHLDGVRFELQMWDEFIRE